MGYQLLLWLIVLGSFHRLQAQVSLTATGGVASATYTTVSQAFDSINNGVHTGAVVLTITANTTEPAAPVSLRKPPASGYTSVKIVPQGVRTIGVNTLNTNRGVLELFGARNVEIDGDDPGVAGVDRSLTIGFYTGSASFNNTAVIRIGSVATPTDSAAGITVKNCNIIGPRPSNTSTAINYGIIIGSNSTSNQLTFGARNRDILIENNSILRCYNGIGSYSSGAAANLFSNIVIRGNEIGITGNADDFVGSMGIDCQGSSNAAAPLIIERNQIRVGVNTTSGFNDNTLGINLRPGNPSTVIRYNRLTDIMNNNTLTGAGGLIVGIFMSGADNTNIDVNNNFIKDVIGSRKQTANFLEANYGIYANGVGSARFNHNTIAFNTPNYVGTGTNTVSSCMALMGSTAVLELNNNILVNRNASTNAYCLGTMTNLAPFTNTVMDKNCYFFPNGSMSNVTNPTTLANWQSVTGRDQNSFTENPPFVSASDLHIQTGVVTRLESNAVPTGYAFDIDLVTRPNPTDIGADEFAGTPYIAPRILTVSHSPTTQTCFTSTPRTVSALFVNPGGLGNSLDSVMLEYNVNGGTNQYLRMNSVSAFGFTQTIPAVTPLNATVRYRVLAVTRMNDTVSSNYFYYNDNTASRALLPTILSNPPQACVTSTVQLNYAFSSDPTGFLFPPNVVDTNMRTNITNVKLVTIDNTTPDSNSLQGTLGTATGVRGAYSNFRNFTVDTVSLGRSYPVSITGSTVANVKLYFAAFIDFDGDGSFTSANETVFNTIQARTLGTRTENFSLYIPPNARPGKTCIRFICSHAPIVNSFFNILRGEVEDYSIYIRPLSSLWKTGATTIGSNNPQNFTIASLPSTVYLELIDSAGCSNTTNPISITTSAAGMNVTLSAPVTSCYNVPVLIRANVTGGCPPYTYSWSNNATLNSPTQVITLLTDTLFLTVTVTDKNGSQYSRTGFIRPNNPRLTTPPPDTTIICNRGTANISVNTANTDSAFWYLSAASSPFQFDFQGKTFTTPTLGSNRNFYVAAARSLADSVGKMNTTGTTVTTGVMPIGGLQFDAMEPVIIRDCQMYLTGNTGATISIALLDKYGNILAELNNYALTPVPANITIPTRIPLNFAIPNVDTGYRLVLRGFTNLTGLTRNTTGFTYPFNTPANRPLIITKSYEIGNPSTALTNYYYFYNLRVSKGVCVGQKDTTTAKVTPPTVPSLYEDLKYTLLCKDDTLNIKVSTRRGADSIGNRFVWLKNGVVLQNFKVNPPSDTFPDSFYRVPISTANDTGLYQVRIFSTRFCTRDTFSREVRVSFHKEPLFKVLLNDIDVCLKRNAKLAVTVENASTYKWYKDNIYIAGSDSFSPEFNITNADFTQTGIYRVVATDSNRCRDVSSFPVSVVVRDTPQFVSHPIDTVICANQRYVMKTIPINALTFQWYKDNGIMKDFIKDSLTLFSSKISDSGSYRLVAKSYPGCPDAVSNAAKLIVNPSPIIQGFYPSQMKFCESQKLKIEANALNKQEIRWYRGSTLIATQDSVVIPSAGQANAGKYSFIVKALNKCTDLNSDTIDVKVFNKPSVSGSRGPFIACEDTTFKFGFSTTNGLLYQWLRNGIPLQSQTDSQLNLQFLSFKDTGTYNVTVNSDPVCPEVRSSSFRIDVRSKPQITLQPVSLTTACMGETIQLVANTLNGNGFQWFKDGLQIPGATANTLIINNLSGSNSGKYWLRITGQSPCKNMTTDTATVVHRSGQTNAAISLVSIYNAVEQCTDGDDWTYYATAQEPDKYLFAVNKKGNNIVGSADIVVRPNTFVSVNNSGKQYTASLMLKRFWNYKLISGNLSSPIEVKFYVNQSELDELDDKKNELINLYGDQLKLENESVNWFRTKGIPFTNALITGVRGNRFNFDSVTIGQYIDGTENGLKYLTFQDVTEVGGGTATYLFKGGSRFLGSIKTGNIGLAANVSPNPSNGQFYLSIISKTLGNIDIQLVNNLGQMVYSSRLKLTDLESEIPMWIPNLANGLYHLVISKDDFNTSLKLQIEN